MRGGPIYAHHQNFLKREYYNHHCFKSEQIKAKRGCFVSTQLISATAMIQMKSGHRYQQRNHGGYFSKSGHSPKSRTAKLNLTGSRDYKMVELKLWKLAFMARSRNTIRKKDGKNK